jgi:hypothetical protein
MRLLEFFFCLFDTVHLEVDTFELDFSLTILARHASGQAWPAMAVQYCTAQYGIPMIKHRVPGPRFRIPGLVCLNFELSRVSTRTSSAHVYRSSAV